MKALILPLVIVSLLFNTSSCAQKNKPKPNVLFIAIDDLNACIEGMEGETTVPTPNINKLSKRGILFTNAHCAAPACNPSRTSVITGVAPSRSGVYMNWQDWRKNNLLKNWTTIPHHFKNNGYKTLGGGKIYHAASLSKRSFTGLLDSIPWNEYYPSKKRQLAPEIKPDIFPANGNKDFYNGYFDWAALDIDPNEMGDAKVVSWAEKQLLKKHEKPLFLAVGIYRPHIPWWTPKEYFDKHPIKNLKMPEVIENDLDDVPQAGQKKARRHWQKWIVENNKWEEAVQAYYASVSFTDDMVGRLLNALNKGPMADNTIIVLWSDHGYHLGQKEHWEKFALWEQTTRVPLIIASPGEFLIGEKCSEAVSLLDIYPTLNELCHIPSTQKLDGKSLVPLLREPTMKTNRMVVSTQGLNSHAVRSDKWRYIRYSDGSEELYSQEMDSKNFTNLSGNKTYKDIKQKMFAHLPKQNAQLDPIDNHKKKKK